MELFRENVIQKIISLLEKSTSKSKLCEFGFCLFVGIINLMTAHNTIAVLIAGPIVHKISKQHHFDSKRIASLLDITSCVVQGLLPYGAHILFASSLSSISTFEIAKHCYYPIVLGTFLIFAILFHREKKHILSAPAFCP